MRELTQEEFQERWTEQCAEWQKIADELIDGGKSPSAYDVTHEQRKRMLAEGRTLVTLSSAGKLLELTPGEERVLRNDAG